MHEKRIVVGVTGDVAYKSLLQHDMVLEVLEGNVVNRDTCVIEEEARVQCNDERYGKSYRRSSEGSVVDAEMREGSPEEDLEMKAVWAHGARMRRHFEDSVRSSGHICCLQHSRSNCPGKPRGCRVDVERR